MDTRKIVIWFEAERQALALIDHPNIAHIYGAGITANRWHMVLEWMAAR